MKKVKIKLDHLLCLDTEDVVGHEDEFYMLGDIRALLFENDPIVEPVVIEPFDIQRFTTKPLNKLVFMRELPDDAVIQVEFAAFDEDSAKDWQFHRDALAKTIGDIVKEGLVMSGNAPAGQLLNAAIAGVGNIVRLDTDDKLGTYCMEYDLASMPSDRSFTMAALFAGGKSKWSDWNYMLFYKVEVDTQ